MSYTAVADSILNFHRSVVHPGISIKFFEMTPTGRTLIIELTDGFTATKLKDKEGLGDTYWEILITNILMTDDIKDRSASINMGGRDLKSTTWLSDFGRIGCWKLTAEFV